MDSTGGTEPEHQRARHRRPRTRPAPDPDIALPGAEPDPAVVIEIGVDVRPAADGTWTVVLTPTIPALRTKHRTGLGSLTAVQVEVGRMLEALAYGGSPVATTWTLDGDRGAWLARATHDPLLTPDTARPPSGGAHPGVGPAVVEGQAGR